jgi:5-methylcytosine-specific restriction protein B
MKFFNDLLQFERLRTAALAGHVPPQQVIAQTIVAGSPIMRVYYGPPGTGKTVEAVRAAVSISDPSFSPSAESGEDRLAEYFQRFFELQDEGRVDFITFSPGTQYETVVEAIRPTLAMEDEVSVEDAGLDYHYWVGPLLKLTRAAALNPEQPHVLVVDEVNRADISQVLGPLIASIERDKRLGSAFPVPFQLRYASVSTPEYIPANLHILGTMNSADRNIALVDVALRRRFEFIRLNPRVDMLRTVGDEDEINVRLLLDAINSRIDQLLGQDFLIGHSYFLAAKDPDEVVAIFSTQILPLLEEYFYGDDAGFLLVLGEHPESHPEHRIYDVAYRDNSVLGPVFGEDVANVAAARVAPGGATASITRKLRPEFWDMSRDTPEPGNLAEAVNALRKIYTSAQEPSGDISASPLTD